MSAETNLARLIATMSPHLHERPVVFCTVDRAEDLDAICIFREAEGVTLILEQDEAERRSLAYEQRWAWITLTVHSSLAAVGFIAAIATRLAQAGLSVNPVSAYYHDHLFVPWEQRELVMRLLAEMASVIPSRADGEESPESGDSSLRSE
jgi:hypothetical protein